MAVRRTHAKLSPSANVDVVTADWVRQFVSQLHAARFRSHMEDQTILLTGSMTVPWINPKTKRWEMTAHVIEIRLEAGFPFQKPPIRPVGFDAVRGSRHQEPGDDGYLCLWRDDDWNPGTSADELLHRIAEWFRHYHRNDWLADDNAPDLHLYFPTNDRRPMMITGRDWPPEDGDIGWFYAWEAGPSRLFAAGPAVVGQVSKTIDDPAARQYGIDPNRSRGHVGLWLRLNREPQPFPTLNQLLDEIDNARGVDPQTTLRDLRAITWRGKPRENVVTSLALGYPTANGQYHWLFLRCIFAGLSTKKQYQTTKGSVGQRSIEAYETAPSNPAALMRRVGAVADTLADKHAVLFGIGALGGHVALMLAEDGVTKITLIDSDRLRPGNAIRHVAGLRYAGKWKLQAVRDVILEHAPYCTVEVMPSSWDPEQLRAIVKGADVVIDATANQSFGHLINSICVAQHVSLITAASHRRGAIGRIRLIRPGHDACLECYEGPNGYAVTGLDGYRVIPPADEDAFIEEGCSTPTIETSNTDIIGIAAATARAGRDLLADRRALGGKNYLLIVQDLIEDLGAPFAELGSHYETFQPVVGCRVCGSAHV